MCITHELVVNEGERVFINDETIKCQLKDVSDLEFTITDPPKHGFIIIDKEFKDHEKEKRFTLWDVLNEKIFYYHDGNEGVKDEIAIKAYLSANEYNLNIQVNIKPKNDPPDIHIFKNIQMSSKLKLTTDILTSEDSDNQPEELIYSFDIDNFVTSSSIWIGKQTLNYSARSYIHEFYNMKRVNKFSHKELVDGEIFVIHSGPPIQNLEVQVSDGISSSSVKNLTVEAYDIKITKVNKTPLKAVHGIWSRLTANNLNYLVTSDHKSPAIIYHLINAPKYGTIQFEMKENQWINIGTDIHYWKQQDILEGKVSCLDEKLSEELFRIEVIEPMVIVERNTGIDLIIDRECIITDSYLLFSTNGEHSNESIFYQLMATPFHGDLKFSSKESKIAEKNSSKRSAHYSLGFESNFTQLDLNQKKITYRLRGIPLHAIVDNFQFVVFIPGYQSGIQKFQINYFPAYPPKIDERLKTKNINYFRLYNNGLFGAFEGLSKIISTKDLTVEPFGTNDYGSFDFVFKITKETKHGLIMHTSKKVRSFRLNDVKKNLVSYNHDDSENDYDSFDFVVVAMEINNSSRVIDDVTDWLTETSGTFEIFIILRNDNEPYRVEDKVIPIVEEEDSVLTPSHIWFNDRDSNYNDLELQYVTKNLSNLFFFYCNKTLNRIERFIQKEIQNGEICIRHYGSIFGENILSVTDGSFTVLAKLNVRAEKVFIKVAGNKEQTFFSKISQVFVKGQNSVLLENKHFTVESNLLQKKNITRNIFFFILSPAIIGDVKIEDEIVWHFTMKDLELKKIKLHINNKSIGHDGIRFLVQIDKHSAIGYLNISSVYDESLRVHKQDILFDISRSKSYKLESEVFSVPHPTTRANEINITVTTKPIHGILSLAGREDVTSFKKSDVNNNNLIYTIVFDDIRLEKLNDSIAFEVSCCSGVILKEILLLIEFKSQVIHLKSVRLSVLEGGMETFPKNLFHFNKKHFTALDIFVIEGPHHGQIVVVFEEDYLDKIDGNKSKDGVTRFSTFQIENNKVSYIHDESEINYDHFVIIGKSINDERISEFLRVEVDIIPVNNKPPVVIDANDLIIEEGSWFQITKEHLYIEDMDTNNDNLIWKVQYLSGGSLVIMNSDDDDDDDAILRIDDCYHYFLSNVSTFSQSQILLGQVAIIGRERGEHLLILSATDGQFITENATIIITIKPFEFNQFTFQTLHVFPGILQKVELKNIFDVQSVSESVPCASPLYRIKFKLLNLSTHGQIMIGKTVADSQIKEIASNFTLIDVLNGNLFYRSNFQTYDAIIHTKEELIFEVFISNYLDLKNDIKDIVAMEIIVSLQNIHNENVDELLSIKNLFLEEGKSAVLTHEHLNDTNLIRALSKYGLTHFYEVIEAPIHGWLYNDKKMMISGSNFKQADVIEDKIKYEHDDSESTEDRVFIQVSLMNGNKMFNKLINDAEVLLKKGFHFKILISSKDDESFQLETQNPSMDLVQGSYKKITKYHLMTSDPDTSPDKIVYRIINQPSNCIFALLNNSKDYQQFEQKYSEKHSRNISLLNNTRSTIFRFGITEFTQSDIDNELLLIIHDSKNSNHDAFYFGVTDGTPSQIFKIFHIKIEPLIIKAKRKSSVLEIEQSNIRSIITPNELDVETNGDRKFIVYNITTEPNFGLIYKKTFPVNSFTQADVDNRLVSYVQTDFSTNIDHFTLTLPPPSNELVTIKMSVVPLDTLNLPLPSLKPGEELIFTTKWIDSRKLAMQTESDPLYEVIKLPTNGELKFKKNSKEKTRSKRDLRSCDDKTKCSENIIQKFKRDSSNNYFTFHRSDILHERISYIAGIPQLIVDNNNINYVVDSFEFILSAPRTQQTVGRVQIQIESRTSNESHLGILHNEIKSEDEEIISHVSDNISNNHISDKLKVVGSIVFVIVIFAAVFIAYKCFKHHKGKQKHINSSNLETGNSIDQKQINPHHIFSKTKTNPPISSTTQNKVVDSVSFEPNVTNLSDESSVGVNDVDQLTITKETQSCLNNEQQTSPNSAKKNRPFDWKKVDPELLQHCRKTTPVLHTNQYWV